MKKKLLFTFYFIGMLATVDAQNFGKVGTVWYYKYSNGRAPSADYAYIKYNSIKDTAILGKACHVISVAVVQNLSISSPMHELSIDTTFFPNKYIYQLGDTVFTYDTEKNKFLRLYTFNVKKGDKVTVDIIESNHAIIDSVQTEKINGISIKKYFATTERKGQYTYIENIGNVKGLFNGIDLGSIPEYSESLKCFSDQSISINFTNTPCDDINIITTVKTGTTSEVKVFPNPTTGILSLKDISGYLEVEIFNANGESVAKSKDTRINMESMPAGMYLLNIRTTGNYFTVKVGKY